MRPTENIKKFIKETDIKTNAETDSAVLQDTLNALEESKKSAQFKPNIGRIIMKSKLTKLAAVAVIVIGIFLGIHYFGGSADFASITFGKVLEQISTFRPYVYKQTIIYEKKPDEIKEVMHLSLSRRREIFPDGMIRIFDMSQRPVRILTLFPEKKLASERILLDMGPLKDPDLLRILARRQEYNAEDLGVGEINGRVAKGFHSPDKINDFIVWVNVKTQLPVYVELRQDQLKRTIIMEDFGFDVDFDLSLFSTTAPEGYSVKRLEVKGKSGMVSVEQMIENSTFETYILSTEPGWCGEVQIMEVSDPVSTGKKMYIFAAIADDGRHLVIAQSETFNTMLGDNIRQGQLIYTSANGFKVWSGGPEKWYSRILLESAKDIIPDSPSEERVGYALESPAGTFPILAVNGPITDEELHSLVDSLVPAKESAESER